MSEDNLKRLPYGEVEFFEDAIARQIRIIREALAIIREIEDPDMAERLSGRLATIIEKANQTRNELIRQRARREAEIEEANDK